jgi:hypothetical protein
MKIYRNYKIFRELNCKKLEAAPWWPAATISQIPVVLGHERLQGAGQMKKDDEGIRLLTAGMQSWWSKFAREEAAAGLFLGGGSVSIRGGAEDATVLLVAHGSGGSARSVLGGSGVLGAQEEERAGARQGAHGPRGEGRNGSASCRRGRDAAVQGAQGGDGILVAAALHRRRSEQ